MSEQKQLDFTPGRWAIFPSTGYYNYRADLNMTRIDAETSKLVKTKRAYGDRFSQIEKQNVVATVATEAEAATLVIASQQIQKSMEAKKKEAEAWGAGEVAKLLESSQCPPNKQKGLQRSRLRMSGSLCRSARRRKWKMRLWRWLTMTGRVRISTAT